MDFFGLSGRVFAAKALLASAGEGSVYTVHGDESLLLKILTRPLAARQVEKLKALAAFKTKPDHAALPIEVVIDPATQTPVGFVQPFFSRAVPLTRALDSHGRAALKLPDDLEFLVKLCRLLAESFARIHAANLVIGDVSDGNFLIGCDRPGRVDIVYAIDCNSFQITIRSQRGTECFVSGVATEQYAAPEVQSTDWSTSLRSVHSDNFGFAVLAWKLLFGGSHPFAVITPRSVDVPPLGERIEKHLFPFRPGSPMPADWKAPAIQPPLSVLPDDVRELFFATFSSLDPRDRPLIDPWCHALRTWERELKPGILERIVRYWNADLASRVAKVVAAVQCYGLRAGVLLVIVALFALLPKLEFPASDPAPTDPSNRSTLLPRGTEAPSREAKRTRKVDPELFPKSLWPPFTP